MFKKIRYTLYSMAVVLIFLLTCEIISYFVLIQSDPLYIMPIPINTTFRLEKDLRQKLKKDNLKDKVWILPSRDLIWSVKPNLNITINNFNRRNFPDDRYKRFTIKTNSRGFRTPEIKARDDVGYRIVCIGDSNVFGWALSEGETFSDILRKDLRDYNCEVINMGCPGYTSTQGLALLKQEVIVLRPNLIVVWFGDNDNYVTTQMTDSEFIQYSKSPLGTLRNFLFANSYSFRLMHKICRQWNKSLRYRDGRGIERVPLEEFKRNLKDIILLCRQNKIEPILMLHLRRDDPYEVAIQSICEAEKAPFIDIRSIYRDNFCSLGLKQSPSREDFESKYVNDWIIPGDGHPTILASRLIASELEKRIKELGKL